MINMGKSFKNNDESSSARSIGIDAKWEKYKKEKVPARERVANIIFVPVALLGVIMFLTFLYAFYLGNDKGDLISLPIFMISAFVSAFLVTVIFEQNTRVKAEFYKENQDQIMSLEIEEVLELTDILEENEKKIFLIISSEVRGMRKQNFKFVTKSEKGNELREYEKESESEFFYHQINKFKDDVPRLEVKVRKFASKSLESEFKDFVSPHLLYCYQYTFFIPEGSVKKIFV